ncbi:putative lipoprotein [Enhygromyxa salina]|uniref:Putative lipoprotein n=1 Tax=Enhygromyxa salina TaxID=215803 RepID=A0A0C1ZP44_9BACT|nr:putative lipoprotein [Enhygromyxa salina]
MATACASGEGQVEVRAWGEDFIEVGIPAAEFADGWAVSFERFEVVLRDVSVAGATLADPAPLELAQPSEGVGQLVGRAVAPAGDHDDARFSIAQLEIEGRAIKDGVEKTFAWSFATPVDYTNCETLTQVPRDGVGQLLITVHADHLFYDSIVSEDPDLRFNAIAEADTNADGVVTQAELESADLGAYDPGNLEIDDLWAFLSAQVQTMGHVDGEGHCAS